MAERHWQQVSNLVGSEVNPTMEAAECQQLCLGFRVWGLHLCTLKTYTVQNFTLEKFVECPPHAHKALILSRQLQPLASTC